MAAFSEDGTRVVTAYYDRTVRVWSVDGTSQSVIRTRLQALDLGAIVARGGVYWNERTDADQDGGKGDDACLASDAPRGATTDVPGRQAVSARRHSRVTIHRPAP